MTRQRNSKHTKTGLKEKAKSTVHDVQKAIEHSIDDLQDKFHK